jgi:hypothetical protein
MTMSTRSQIPHRSSTEGLMPWLFDLAIRMLARALNMPEPLVHSTGVIVVAQVQAVETSVGKTLCPPRLRRRLRSLLKSRPKVSRRPSAR